MKTAQEETADNHCTLHVFSIRNSEKIEFQAVVNRCQVRRHIYQLALVPVRMYIICFAPALSSYDSDVKCS